MQFFGIKFRRLRTAQDMTQQELANKLKVNRATISSYETSALYPSVSMLVAIARYFNVSTDYLLGLTEEQNFDMSRLTDEQVLSVQEIIQQYTLLNNQLAAAGNQKQDTADAAE